ncbi:P-loop NTPase [Aliarcobacter cryaerophilus]|uniref:P-loop NTPase n=1 Tax=Aliarcobacter cryaerophilus TaxID=28198 RepID=UPI0008241705|nr:SIR2 family protein [Aliarcobacter cryaerophilus]
MGYKLCFERHKSLLKKIQNGEVTLLTGAGFSLGAKIKENNILSTNELIDKILLEILECEANDFKRIKERKSIKQICQLAIDKITENEFNNIITRWFSNVIPTEFHKKYSTISWKEIFTLNIDDLIENVYKETNFELQVYNTRKQPQKIAGDNIVSYYKLHGDVRNKSEGFVFSNNQYLTKLSAPKYSYNFIKLAEALYMDTICIIGTRLDEIDLDNYIERFDKGMGAQLPIDKIYYINRTIYPEDELELKKRNIECIEETAESFINKVEEYIILNKKKDSNLRIIKKVPIEKTISNIGFNLQINLMDSYTKEQILRHKPILFYTGFEPKWIDIISQSDAILTNTDNLKERINSSNTFNLSLLLGKSGNGKTTCVKRIVYDYSINNDYYVLVHDENIQLYDDNAKKLAEFINKSDKKFIIFFDNGSWAFNFTSRLYNYLIEEKSVSIIITSRIPEYYREMRNLHNIPNSIFNFDEVISYENAKKIVLKLEEKSYLGKLINFKDIDERVNNFMRSSRNSKFDLFSSLVKSTSGQGFYNTINSKVRDKMKDKENELFLTVLSIFDSFGSYHLPLNMYLNIFKNKITNLHATIADCSDLLNHNNIQDYENLNINIRPRGSFVTRSILNYVKKNFDKKMIFEISKEILIYISSNYDINFKKGKNLYTEVTHTLLISKLYYKYFEIKDKKLNDNFYHSLSSYFTNNSDFWLQYARMEIKLKDFDSARIHLEQALTLTPSSYKIQHTIGQWHMLYSLTMGKYSLAKEEFEKGEKIMFAQFSINDAYPVHSYVDGFMQLHKVFKFELDRKKIKDIYSIITNSIERFNEHSLLLIIWKKFYQFLEKNKKLYIISISLDDKKRLELIDITKDAEEQYLI